jgi:hypothetical protein
MLPTINLCNDWIFCSRRRAIIAVGSLKWFSIFGAHIFVGLVIRLKKAVEVPKRIIFIIVVKKLLLYILLLLLCS